jgi:hypothetical protein
VSLDGTDFPINEPGPGPRNPGWYSHKFRGPGLRYEIGISIKTGNICWANGGYPCGSWPDLNIARDSYVHYVDDNELTLGDKGYRGDARFITPTESNGGRHKQIMARHETVNKRIRQFNILNKKFRNALEKHPRCFHAVVNITQILLENGYPLYSV